MVRQPDSKATERDTAATVHGAAGHVEVDARGNSVWRWSEQGPLDTTSILLKRLENDALELEATRKAEQPGIAARPKNASAPSKRRRGTGPEDWTVERGHKDSGGGFDPYNNT
jgi:hypothetical protein